ncbi:MAG: hypothetical protein ACQEVA_07960 [Myxococcota bacterium]
MQAVIPRYSAISIALFALLISGSAWADTPDESGDTAEEPTPSEARETSSSGVNDPIVVDYTGRIQDEKSNPVSGVFKLRFKLLKTEKSANPTWAETRYVAVVDGDYRVGLGQRRKLRKRQIPDSAWIGVELVGEGEIVRDRFDVDSRSPDKKPDKASSAGITQETKDLLEKAANDNSIAFADVAQRAVTADTATTADKANAIGDLSAQELKDLSNVALERLGEHIADPTAHEAAGGIRIGNERQITESAGGSGGKNYELKCPSGYVVTGIRGGAGRLVDSISLICQPLR